ncbi:amidohydrolase family protein [bacterium]|nr:amidohydrolase family protein [bacterium]
MYDILIQNATIVDGSGKEQYPGDIAITNGKISDMGMLQAAEAKTVINANEKVVCPGFIDIHSHADLMVPHANQYETLKPLVKQGITTFIGGNCGFSNSLIPDEQRENCINSIEGLTAQDESECLDWKTPAEFMEKAEKRGLLLNMGLLAGHGSLRIAAAGLVRRHLTPAEQQKMETYLEQSLEMGCLGMSSGLQYYPGLQSNTEELVRTGSVLKKTGGVFTSHMRSYCHTIDQSLDEVFEVGRKNDIRVVVSHLYWQPYSKGFTGLVQKLVKAASFAYNRLHIPIPIENSLQPKIRKIEDARDKGLDVFFDLVPTSQGFTTLFAFFPPYVVEGSKKQALERLKDRKFRQQVLFDIENVEPDWPHNEKASWSFNYIKITGWGGLRVMAVTQGKNQWMEGKTFPEIGKELDKTPMDTMCDLLIEEEGKVLVFHTPTKPDDPFAFRSMWRGFTHPLSMPATDTILLPFGRPSHVFYDCFPRFIDYFVKKRPLLSLEEAIRKCTSLPAGVMNLKNRGTLKQGNAADILLFDLKTLGTTADFYNPRVSPSGIDSVIINGEIALQNGVFQNNVKAGKVIRGNSSL